MSKRPTLAGFDPLPDLLPKCGVRTSRVRAFPDKTRFELEGDPYLPVVREFIDGKLRRDLRDLSVYAWLYIAAVGDREKSYEEL